MDLITLTEYGWMSENWSRGECVKSNGVGLIIMLNENQYNEWDLFWEVYELYLRCYEYHWIN